MSGLRVTATAVYEMSQFGMKAETYELTPTETGGLKAPHPRRVSDLSNRQAHGTEEPEVYWSTRRKISLSAHFL